jgi:hypothetical protein
MTIVTSEKEFKVHKLLVCSQSGFFARIFDGNWAGMGSPISDKVLVCY